MIHSPVHFDPMMDEPSKHMIDTLDIADRLAVGNDLEINTICTLIFIWFNGTDNGNNSVIICIDALLDWLFIQLPLFRN